MRQVLVEHDDDTVLSNEMKFFNCDTSSVCIQTVRKVNHYKEVYETKIDLILTENVPKEFEIIE